MSRETDPPVVAAGARGFSRTAELYERARPSYPAEAVDALVAEFGLEPDARIVDVGAGTGKWARLLVERGFDVIAVEPIAEMRAQLELAVPGATALAGSAEDIPVADESAHVVTAAQAFHWFHLDRALPEMHRVLHAGGGLAAVWNERDRSDPVQVGLDQLVAPYRRPYPAGDLVWQREIEESGLFGKVRQQSFPYVQMLDADTFIQRVASISWIGSLDDERRTDVLERARALVAGRDEPFPFRYVTEVFTCRRR